MNQTHVIFSNPRKIFLTLTKLPRTLISCLPRKKVKLTKFNKFTSPSSNSSPIQFSINPAWCRLRVRSRSRIRFLHNPGRASVRNSLIQHLEFFSSHGVFSLIDQIVLAFLRLKTHTIQEQP